MQPLTPQTFVRAFLAFLLGLVLGALGTVVHRGAIPWGLLAAVALVLAATVMVRAWGGWAAFVGLAGGVFLSVQLLAQSGPGGDVLVPGGDHVKAPWIGWVWIVGAMVALVLGALAPKSWFDDRPRPPRPSRTGAPSGGPAVPGAEADPGVSEAPGAAGPVPGAPPAASV